MGQLPTMGALSRGAGELRGDLRDRVHGRPRERIRAAGRKKKMRGEWLTPKGERSLMRPDLQPAGRSLESLFFHEVPEPRLPRPGGRGAEGRPEPGGPCLLPHVCGAGDHAAGAARGAQRPRREPLPAAVERRPSAPDRGSGSRAALLAADHRAGLDDGRLADILLHAAALRRRAGALAPRAPPVDRPRRRSLPRARSGRS